MLLHFIWKLCTLGYQFSIFPNKKLKRHNAKKQTKTQTTKKWGSQCAQNKESGHMVQIPYFGHTGFPKTIVFVLLLSLLYFFYTFFILFYTFLYFLNGFG